MTDAKTKIAIIAAATAAVPIGAQWNTIGNLKEEAEAHREREVEFVQQGERLATLEKQIESLPVGLLASNAENAGTEGQTQFQREYAECLGKIREHQKQDPCRSFNRYQTRGESRR